MRIDFKHLRTMLAIVVFAAVVGAAAPTASATQTAKRAPCAGHQSRAHHRRGGRHRRCRGHVRAREGLAARAAPGSMNAVQTTASVRPVAPEAEAPLLAEAPESGEPFRFYSPTSFWNAPVPATAPLDPKSEPVVAAFNALVASEFRASTGPSINTTEYSVPIYTVPATQPIVKVTLDTSHAPALQAAWSAVPMPANARPATGTDATLVIWQPSSNKLWDFWRARHQEDGWHAAWGGATQNVSSASGWPDPESWPGAQPWWGTSGCSLGIVGGLITLEDLEMGVINHALQMEIPNVRAAVYASPALRTDGKTEDLLALPEGAHLRLDPNLDLETLNLPRLTLILARAAQRYGIFVTNGASDVTFQAQDPTPTGTEPYRGPDGFWEGSYPRALLSHFPWSHLQLLRMELHDYPAS
jgi:hypothetical protein